MKPVALISGPFFHHLDHLAPLTHFLNCPLLVDDATLYSLGKLYYPEVDIRLNTIDLRSLADSYNFIVLSTKYAKMELETAYKAMNIHHMRFCYCPHGHSDKGLFDPTMIPEKGQDIVLCYSEHEQNRLGLKNSHVVGNFRLAYYEKFRPFFDAVVEKELSLFPKQKTILYAPTWNDQETATTFFESWQTLIAELPTSYNLIIKLHPLLEKHHPAHAHAALAFDKVKPNVRILFEFPLIYPLLARTEIYLGDYSAIGYDFLYFNRPLFFLGKTKVPLYNFGIQVPSAEAFFPMLDLDQSHLQEKRAKEYARIFSPFSLSWINPYKKWIWNLFSKAL